MMPRIEAGETLAAVSRAALTNNVGYETEAERQRAFEDLRRKATGEAPPKPARADPADLAAMGVAMVGDEADRPVIADLQAWLGNGEQEPASSSGSAAGSQGQPIGGKNG